MYRGYKGTSKPFAGPTKAAILRSDTQGWIKLVTPYNPDFVDELKETIQPGHRSWDPDGKFWKVNEIYLEEIIVLLKKYYSEVTTDLIEGEASDNLFRQVFDVLPKDNVDKVYFALAQALHPDHGGSDQLMKQLNQAYQETK